MTFASIDIGSTAVKFLIASVFENEKGKVEMTKNTFIRIPLRLGTDVFSQGSISEERIGNLIRVLSAFNTIIDFGDVVTYDICATSAMREAKNSKEIVSRVEKETGMKIRVISGDEEASIIRGGVFSLKDEKNQNEMFIDVGGGSTEISISCNGRVMNSHSFPVGTVRLLQNSVHKDTWEELDMWLSDHLKGIENFECIGSGGNISKLVKRFGDPFSQTMSYKNCRQHTKNCFR